MGMSASQTRVLMLTARQNDLEYQAQQILQAKLAASRQAEDIAAARDEKLANTHFIKKEKVDGNEVQMNVTISSIMDNGYYLIDENGSIVLPSRGEYSYSNFIEEHSSRGDSVKYGFESWDDASFKSDKNLNNDMGGADSYIKEMIDKGKFTLCRLSNANDDQGEDGEYIGHRKTSIDASYDFTEVYYTADDAEAESKFETASRKLETLEKKLDMQMEQIETERTAVKTEKESVEKVVDENVESTFKTFG